MIETTDEQLDELKTKLQEGNVRENEKLWNFLIASILDDAKDRSSYVSRFTDDSVIDDGSDIWFESKPLPPRKGEGNTVLDFSFGDIKGRGKTKSGIEYDEREDSWVCFVEGKLFSDCSTRVRKDPLRNQLIRIIENLLCFQSKGEFPDELYFTLLTPRLFKENRRSKLYCYKMLEYWDEESDAVRKENILRDIGLCRNERRDQPSWRYPDIEGRLDRLKIRWVTYEEILEEEYGLEGLDVTDLGDEDLERFGVGMEERLEKYIE